MTDARLEKIVRKGEEPIFFLRKNVYPKLNEVLLKVTPERE